MTNLDCYSHLFKWLEIKEKHGLEFPGSADQLKISMMKSALLNRLFAGKEAFPIPPPLRFSYPWYLLIENGEDICNDVWEADGWVEKLYNYPVVMICQFPWKIVKKISDKEWLVTYEYKIFNQTKLCEDTWHVFTNNNIYWTVKKLNF